MPQKPGTTGNPNGRPKGTPNKVTAETRRYIADLVSGNLPKIKKALRDLQKENPYQFLTIMERLLSYSIPKMSEIDIKAQVEEEYKQLFQLLENCPEELLDKLTEKISELKNTKENE